MRTFVSLVVASIFCLPTLADAKVRVAATIPALGAIAKEVVGDLGTVTVLASPTQDPHFVDGKPSLMLSLNRADLLIHAGADLELGWLPTLLTGARNGAIQQGQPGNLDCSTLVGPLRDVPERLDRALGDVHAAGNPHVWYDPRKALLIAQGIGERLAALSPEHADAFRANAAGFQKRLRQKMVEWEAKMAPHKGRGFVPYHKSLTYLADWLGLVEVAPIEPLPGITPSPSHLASLIVKIRGMEPKPVVVAEPWYNQRLVLTVVEKSGAPHVRLAGDVGSTRQNGDYLSFLDDVIGRLLAGLEGR
jgi:zinc/manganese transport system substrate-binding protein